MARRNGSQARTPVDINIDSRCPEGSFGDEPFPWPTDGGLDSPIPTLGVIELPESDPGDSERGGFLPVEPVCVSTGNPPENLQRVSLPPMAKPLASDPTADLSPVLLDIQLPDVELPQPAGARNERPGPSETNQGDSPGTVTSSDSARPGTGIGSSAPAHRGRSLRGCLLLIAMIAAAGSLIALLIFLLKTPAAPTELVPSKTWLAPVEPEQHSKPPIDTPVDSESVKPTEPKIAHIATPTHKDTVTPDRKPERTERSWSSSPPKRQPTVLSIQEDRKIQAEEPEQRIPIQEAVPTTPHPRRERPDLGSQPKPVRSKRVTRARPTRSITFPESALRLLHDQQDAEIIVMVAVNRFGFPKATEVRSNEPLPDLVIGLFERAIDDVNWIPAKSESGESIADVVSVRFRAVEGGS